MMNRKDAGIKAFEMLAEADRDGISTYDTVTLVRCADGTYDMADNGDAVAGLNEHEAITALTTNLIDHN